METETRSAAGKGLDAEGGTPAGEGGAADAGAGAAAPAGPGVGAAAESLPPAGTGMPAEPGVRERLIRSATDLFNRKGYAGTTVREIVVAAGVTKPVLYYYFRSKEGIFLEIMGEAFSQFDAVLDASRGEAASARGRILHLGDRVLALFVRHIEVARLMYSIYYGPPQGAPRFDFDAYHVRFQQAVRGLVEEGIRSGEFRRENPDDMTWAVIGAINVAMEAHLCHPEQALDREGLKRVLALIFRGLEAAPARGGRPRRGAPAGIKDRRKGDRR